MHKPTVQINIILFMIRIDVCVYTSLQTATIVEINNVENNTKPHYTASPVQRHWPHADKDFLKHHFDNGSTLRKKNK